MTQSIKVYCDNGLNIYHKDIYPKGIAFKVVHETQGLPKGTIIFSENITQGLLGVYVHCTINDVQHEIKPKYLQWEHKL